MKGAMKLIGGLLLIIVGIYIYATNWQIWGTYAFFRHELIELLKLFIGNIPLIVIIVGLILILLGSSDMKG